jgi:hypothetical protein
MGSGEEPEGRTTHDLREFTRIRSSVEVDVTCDGRIGRGTTRDVSMKGAFVSAEEPLAPGVPCRVSLLLDGRGGSSRIAADARLVRASTEGFAIEFIAIVGVNSYWNLHNLVTQGSEDAARIEQEIADHPGPRRE